MIGPGLLAGGLIGGGFLLALRLLVDPPQPALSGRLERLYEPRSQAGRGPAMRMSWQRWALQTSRLGRANASLDQDLAVCGIPPERHAAVKVGMALGGAATPALLAVLWTAAGIGAPAGPLLIGSLVAAGVGFVLPDSILARRAAERRREFRFALSLFLDLVVIVIAAGGGVTTALHDAAGAGSGWTFDELRHALASAQIERRSPWVALRELGERIGSPELQELASAVELAGASGAKVRESLRTKAISVRDHEHSESEADALAASERMGAPMVGMFVGLVLLIGYPAMATVLAL